MKMRVRPARRILSAISFGVFWRSAPSTRAIMRSMNVSPGAAVICTTMRSESTRVPPVTAERSPPDSRMTGADSPVIADSSTAAMPSMTSPSPGITSPGLHTTSSPMVRALDGLSTIDPSRCRTWATVSERVLRSVSAWALPRPSARASAKFANSTVNHNHNATRPPNTLVAVVALLRSRKNSTEVHTAPTSTTNMIGLRASVRGLSFRNASPTALRTMTGSKSDVVLRSWRCERGCSGAGGGLSIRSVGMSLLEVADEVLDDGAERDDREVDQPHDDRRPRQQHAEEQGGVRAERAGGGGDDLLPHDRAADGEHRDDGEEAPDQHREPERDVVPLGV